MATESDLRDLLRGPEPEGRAAIDLDAVLDRARRRRRPRVIAVQALGSVAMVGAIVTGVAVALPTAPDTSMLVAENSGGAVSDEFAPSTESSAADPADVTLLWVPAEVCGSAYTAPTATTPLTLVIDPVSAEGSSELAVPVTLRNDGTTAVSGVVSIPRIVLTRDGVIVGHAPAVDEAGLSITLEPGATTAFGALIQPFLCDPNDPFAAPDVLEVLSPGSYEMRPVAQFAVDGNIIATIVGDAQELQIR